MNQSELSDHVAVPDVSSILRARVLTAHLDQRATRAHIAAPRGSRSSTAATLIDRLNHQRRRRESSTSRDGGLEVRRDEVALPIKRRTTIT